jgi:exosortase A
MVDSESAVAGRGAPFDLSNGAGSSPWRVVLVACVAVFLGVLALFWSTAAGMVHIWYNFETYTHGFIILPISLWLIWQKRHHLAAYTPQPMPAAVVLILFSLLAWSLARLTGVQVVEQASLIATIVIAVSSLLGWQVSKFLAFPLLFLFFAVPMGEDLIPPMMEFTATFTVEALKLTGIPVYRDGLWFSLPSGDWSVVEACSGVRYLIASATLGVMYAYITYHTLWKRLLFIAMSIIVPVIANGIRAYIIVMIGHLSSMKYATGVDHLIYGWVFFGIVMFILFWIGSFWQEEQDPPETVIPARKMTVKAVHLKAGVITLLVLGATALTVGLTHRAEQLEVVTHGTFSAPPVAGDWVLEQEPVGWSLQHLPSDFVIEATYRRGAERANLLVVLFPRQTQGTEAISKGNQIADNLVRQVNLGRAGVSLGQVEVRVNRQRAIIPTAGSGSTEHLVWQWYHVAGRSLTNRYVGKGWEAISRLYPGRADGAWIAVSTPLEDIDTEASEQRLADFAEVVAPLLKQEIDRLLGR